MSLQQEAADFNQELQADSATKAKIANTLAPILGENFAEQLKVLLWQWRIEERDSALRFNHRFPYETAFEIGEYSMRGWDEAGAIVDFIPGEKRITLFLHLHDNIADFTVRTLVGIQNGQITYFDESYATSDFRYRNAAMGARDMMIKAKGENGCLFDTTLKPYIDVLPDLVRETIGSNYGKLASAFFDMVDGGKIDPARMEPPELVGL